jgi:hypothetical protein
MMEFDLAFAVVVNKQLPVMLNYLDYVYALLLDHCNAQLYTTASLHLSICVLQISRHQFMPPRRLTWQTSTASELCKIELFVPCMSSSPSTVPQSAFNQAGRQLVHGSCPLGQSALAKCHFLGWPARLHTSHCCLLAHTCLDGGRVRNIIALGSCIL